MNQDLAFDNNEQASKHKAQQKITKATTDFFNHFLLRKALTSKLLWTALVYAIYLCIDHKDKTNSITGLVCRNSRKDTALVDPDLQPSAPAPHFSCYASTTQEIIFPKAKFLALQANRD